MPKQTIFLETPFFVFITENFWRDFWCNNWRSIFDVVERLLSMCLIWILQLKLISQLLLRGKNDFCIILTSKVINKEWKWHVALTFCLGILLCTASLWSPQVIWWYPTLASCTLLISRIFLQLYFLIKSNLADNNLQMYFLPLQV